MNINKHIGRNTQYNTSLLRVVGIGVRHNGQRFTDIVKLNQSWTQYKVQSQIAGKQRNMYPPTTNEHRKYIVHRTYVISPAKNKAKSAINNHWNRPHSLLKQLMW